MPWMIGIAQKKAAPFQKEIDAFRLKDSIHMPARRSILFVGSSSFTKWTDMQDYFPGYPVINRGFGGSSLTDLIHYANSVIFPYHPKQIVIYCGENDVAASEKVTAKQVLLRFKKLFFLIRKRMQKVPVAFISIKPSPSRWKFEPVFRESNRRIKRFLQSQPHTRFVNIHQAMLNPDGSVMKDIFVADNLHMNSKGYAIWQPIIRRYLLK